jgi:hypothetical protein
MVARGTVIAGTSHVYDHNRTLLQKKMLNLNCRKNNNKKGDGFVTCKASVMMIREGKRCCPRPTLGRMTNLKENFKCDFEN